MLTEQDWLALAALEGGAVMNNRHTIARGLVAQGLAYESWDRIEISEAGRRAVRSRSIHQMALNEDAEVADMSRHVFDPAKHPMGPPDPIEAFNNPDAAQPGTRPVPPPRVPPGTPLPDPPPPADAPARLLEPAESDHVRALRAAGVATGLTGIEVEPRWVREFVVAWVNA